MPKRFFATVFFTFSFLYALLGQTTHDTIQWRIQTLEGNEFIGLITEETKESIQLSTKNFGILLITKDQIKLKQKIQNEKIVGNVVWTDNPQSTRYFWAPNGYGLKKGEGYYQNNLVLFNQASYGITNYFTTGIGVMPLFLLAGSETPVWITPKFSIPIVKNKFNLGAGVLAGTVIGAADTDFGIAYGVATYGDKNMNINLGLGYGFAQGDWAEKPTLTLSAMVRMSRRGYFITENYLIHTGADSHTLISFGGRTVWQKLSLDYGLIIPITEEIDGLIAIPWLGLVLPFGHH